jgi:hypothetical protein
MWGEGKIPLSLWEYLNQGGIEGVKGLLLFTLQISFRVSFLVRCLLFEKKDRLA